MPKITRIPPSRAAILALTIMLTLLPAKSNAEEAVDALSKLKACYKSQFIRLVKEKSPNLQSVDDEALEGLMMADEEIKKTFELLNTAALVYVVSDDEGRKGVTDTLKGLDVGGLALGTAMQACNLIVIGQ